MEVNNCQMKIIDFHSSHLTTKIKATTETSENNNIWHISPVKFSKTNKADHLNK